MAYFLIILAIIFCFYILYLEQKGKFKKKEVSQERIKHEQEIAVVVGSFVFLIGGFFGSIYFIFFNKNFLFFTFSFIVFLITLLFIWIFNS